EPHGHATAQPAANRNVTAHLAAKGEGGETGPLKKSPACRSYHRIARTPSPSLHGDFIGDSQGEAETIKPGPEVRSAPRHADGDLLHIRLSRQGEKRRHFTAGGVRGNRRAQMAGGNRYITNANASFAPM